MASPLPGPRKGLKTTMAWVRNPPALLQEGKDRYGDIWAFRMQAGITFVFIYDPVLVEQVFTADPTVVHGGDAYAQLATALLGKHSLIVLDESEHDRARALLRPSFHADHVERFRDHVTQACEASLATWPLHTPIATLARMQEITLHTIMTAIFGVSGPVLERLQAAVTELVAHGSNGLRMAMIQVWRLRDRIPRTFAKLIARLDAEIYDVIATARRDANLAQRDDVLAMLLCTTDHDGTAMSDVEVRDELVTLLMQGHQSTGTALAWALERLTRHPDVLGRLRDELEAGKDEYLDAVVRELLRVRPPLPMALRMAKQPYEIGGFEVEPGMSLAPCSFIIQRRADIYPEPLQFRPERFLGKPESPYTWFPFGGPPRNCIGRSFATMEVKMVLRTLVLNARFEPSTEPDEGFTRRGVMFSPKEGGRVVLRERRVVRERVPSAH
jgi:cytochrome P450